VIFGYQMKLQMSKTELSQIVLSVHYILIIKYSDKIYLLHSAVLEKTNNKIVKFIYESLELWPAEIKHEKDYYLYQTVLFI